jgi:hypothetical protein
MMTDEAKTANHYRIRKLLTLEKRQQLLLSNVFGTFILKVMTMFMFCLSHSQRGPYILFHDLSPVFFSKRSTTGGTTSGTSK